MGAVRGAERGGRPVSRRTPDAADLDRRQARPVLDAILLTAGYVVTAVGWLLVSAVMLWSEVVTTARATVIVIANGALFLVFTAGVLYTIIHRHLARLREAEERFGRVEAELRQQDLAVRQGYVDVLDAVTGGKLIILRDEEIRATLGDMVMRPHRLADAKAVSEARRTIAACLSTLPLEHTDTIMLAISEALTNAVKHGRGGEYEIYRSGECLQVVIRDFGPGIDLRALPKATLVQGFSTTSTMGLGFTIMLEVSARVLLTTDSRGTVVALEFEIPGAAEQAGERSLAEILAV